MSCTGRSLAVLMLLLSAIGNASRRNANVLAGRSLAANWLLLSQRPSEISENGELVSRSSLARSEATRVRVSPAIELGGARWLL